MQVLPIRNKGRFLKTASDDFFLNTHFGMWRTSPKIPHLWFLAQSKFYKLRLKTNRAMHLQYSTTIELQSNQITCPYGSIMNQFTILCDSKSNQVSWT
jgi:hypothetical protein